MAKKQVSMGAQILSEPVDYFYLHLPLKIDEHVTAENQVKRAIDRVRFLYEIQPLKSDDTPEFLYGFDFTPLRTKPFQQELSLIFNRYVGYFLDGPDSRRRPGQDLRRTVRPTNLDLPSGRTRKIHHERHGQRISFFTGRTRRAPDPDGLASFPGIRRPHPFPQHTTSQAPKRCGLA